MWCNSLIWLRRGSIIVIDKSLGTVGRLVPLDPTRREYPMRVKAIGVSLAVNMLQPDKMIVVGEATPYIVYTSKLK